MTVTCPPHDFDLLRQCRLCGLGTVRPAQVMSCNGLCVMASDLIEGYSGVAYPHDSCPMHSPLAEFDLEDHSDLTPPH